MRPRGILLLAGVLGAVGMALAAFSAHGLEKWLQQRVVAADEISVRLEQCDIAVRYHMLHVLALLGLGVASSAATSRLRIVAATLFVLGILLFSGGLYAMVFFGRAGHWSIVPSGGLSLIAGWLCVAAMAFPREGEDDDG
ncbi:MAG: DUF423 domain-containing protein [Pirellulaceae bacterium]|nr:MAG: DUF423 domain-containing protein [Pirellulaceae bacterium]